MARETLTYWIQRLDPIIRAETEEEIIVVLCNRCGIEDETVYAGTSTVIGIKQGEVSVYGLLGRCEKKLLVVDTDNPPLGKLVLRTQTEADPVTEPGGEPVPAASRNPAHSDIDAGFDEEDDKDVEISS